MCKRNHLSEPIRHLRNALSPVFRGGNDLVRLACDRLALCQYFVQV